jgi:hypothetical protein
LLGGHLFCPYQELEGYLINWSVSFFVSGKYSSKNNFREERCLVLFSFPLSVTL